MRIILEDPGAPDLFHAGERQAHQRFGVQEQAREARAGIADRLSAGNARFMAAQPFFFLSVCEADGRIFTQMLPCATTDQGSYPLVAFLDEKRFCFLLPAQAAARLPLLASDQGCKAGMIFVDFARRARFRVNGHVRAAAPDLLAGFECPPGFHLMQVQLDQAYANCQSRIVRLKPAEQA
ncbi:hypothetical protein [Comamonas composti]|uniref:hypothetical protein n=1 Tax=Comamonas composti TaxID=408558 RepID=UPI0003F72954|nr:hypothetical protein [Comamonas composti]